METAPTTAGANQRYQTTVIVVEVYRQTAVHEVDINCCIGDLVGRRHVQVQLVECAAKSLNEGDVFLLLTETELFQWIGQESNGFERAKVARLIS